jgi:hypothetical protein
MGCFSFMCKKTGKAGLSTSEDGSPVHLFLLRKGKVIEHMHGNYDSYGRVFKPGPRIPGPDMSFEWKLDWGEVCDLMFSPNKQNGIALIHDSHWNESLPYPIERSESDPDQGWGEETDWRQIDEPFHKFNF